MPRFGRYEGLEEIHRGALSAVWTVRGPDGATRVARTFEPGRVALDPGQAESRVRAYLEEVRDLQEFAGASRRWARIHEVGEHEGGAYVVMDHYPMTAERLIKGRVQLSERDLDRVGDTVLRGLKELADRRGKPYGKLQPSNVFLGRVSRLSEDDVFLDPLGAIGGSGEDLSDLGDLIYQLVFFRAAHDVTTLDLGTRPGKFARYLLEARTGEGVTLEGALEYWEGLKPPDRGTRWWQVAAAAAVVLGLAVGVWLITGNGENGTNGTNGTANGGTVVVKDEDWAAYQAAYDQWLGAFLDSVRGDRSVLALYGSDEQLRDRWAAELETFLKEHSKIPYPRRRDPSAPALVRIFRGIEGTLREPAGWNLLARLETTSRDYDTRGWKSEAGFLRSLAADVQGASVEKIREVFKARDRIESLEETWNLIQERHKTLEGSENAFLARFEDHAHTWTRSDGAADGDLERLATQLTAIAEVAGELEAFVKSDWPKVVREQLTEELRQGPEDDVKRETYSVWWLSQVRQYRELGPDDVREKKIADLRGTIDTRLEDLVKHDDCGPKAATPLRGKLEELVDAFDAGKPTPIAKNANAVEKHHDGHIVALGTLLNTVVDEISKCATSQQDWWTSTEQLAVSSPSIVKFYVSQRDALRAARKIGGLMPAEYSELREAIAALRTDLQALDRELARLPRELDGSFAGKLQARADLEREAALGKALTGTAVPEHEGAEFAPYVEWVEDVEDLAGDFAGVERLLGQFYLLDEKPPGGDSPRELHDRGTARGVFDDVREALTTVTERVDGLDAILGETDSAVLLRHTEDEARPELVHAAWRRLGEVEGWPAGRAHLDREDRFRNTLGELFRDAPEARKTDLEGKLSSERPKRWLACFRRLTEHREIGDVAAQMKAFGVDLEDLDPGLRFKHELHDFRAQLERLGTAAEDDEVAPVVESFIGGVTRRPAIAGAPGVAEILEKLREAAQTEGGGGGKKTGPASMELVAPALRSRETPTETGVLFAWSYQGREHSLEFIRLEAPPGQSKDFYLATTEVSVGLFRDVLLAAGEEEARKFDPEKGARDGRLPQKTARYGPCVWEWDSVTVRNRSKKDVEPRNTRRGMVGWWQNPDPPAIGENGVQVYDPFYVDPVTEPSTEHPMQHLPLPCASRFAVLLGCRLPTVAEWEKARSWQTSRNEEGAATAPANLRDAAWERQQAHFESFYDSLGRGASGTRLSAEEGIFQAQPAAGEERPEPVKEDGILWFRELEGRPGQFSDLVGNVAEFATWELLEPVELQGSGQPSRKTLDKFCIIGGSALSLPELWPETPHKILRLRDRKPDWSGARRGFSDVGLRLAFTAWRRPLIDRIAEVLEDDLYGLLTK